jgi:hydrogenase maturation protease
LVLVTLHAKQVEFVTKAIAGIGSPHQEDSVGWRVVALAQERLPHAIIFYCAAVPLDLLLQLEGRDELIVVDACRCGMAAESVLQIDWDVWRQPIDADRSTHSWGLRSSLQLTETLGMLPAQTKLLLIEVGDGLQSKESDEAVEAAASTLANTCSAILESVDYA